jgi:predicted nucleic acid-binding protein
LQQQIANLNPEQRAAGEDVAISVVTLIELAHGMARANTPQRKAARRQFLNELMTALPVHPLTAAIALRAGQIDGENVALGVRVALFDLLIGVTALELGCRVATANLRHFQMVPGLGIVVF